MSTEIKTHFRACHLCEAICGVEIKTRGSEILSIKGDPDDPFSRGHICPKATALGDIHNDPDLLRQPMLRKGKQWQAIGWQQAYELVAENLVSLQQQYGNNCVGIFSGNPGTHNYGCMTHGGILRKVLKTENIYSAASLDQLPLHVTALALYGHQYLIPVPDIDRCKYMLIIGANPLASNGSMMTVPDVTKRLKTVQKDGGKLVVIDPRRSETAEIADQHFFIRPGSDGFLLLAMINTLFSENLVNCGHLSSIIDNLDEIEAVTKTFSPEFAAARTGIDANTIRQLARDMAGNKASVCYGRMGVSVQEFGTLCQWAIQLINILSNSMDVPGGAIAPTPAFGHIGKGSSGAGHLGRWHSRVSGLPEVCGQLPAAVLAEEMLTQGEGQIKALITVASNPVISAPGGRTMDKALESLDFMVSIDFYINATTRHAHLILPPTNALEHDHYDLAYHRLAVRNTTRYNPPVFSPAEDSQHDWQIFNGLGAAIAKRKDLGFQPQIPPDEVVDRGIKAGPYGEDSAREPGLSMAEIKNHPHGLDLGPLQAGLAERLCTQNGRIDLAPDFIIRDVERLHAKASSGITAINELLLIGRRHIRSNNSWMHNSHRLIKGKPRWQLLMHPDDLKQRKLENNSEVRIKSRVGEIVTTVIASDEVMPGVISLPHGWGHQRSGIKMAIASKQQGVSCNDITDSKLMDPLSGTSALNGVPVTVVAA